MSIILFQTGQLIFYYLFLLTFYLSLKSIAIMASRLLIPSVNGLTTIVKATGSTMATFDLRRTLIPFSLLKITNAFNAMQPGEEMEVLSGTSQTESAIFKDLMRILPESAYELVSKRVIAGEEPAIQLKLKKR